jgi:hypothetical protein
LRSQILELHLYAQILEKQGKWDQLKATLMSDKVQDLVKVEKDLHSWILRINMQLQSYDQALRDSIKLLESHVDDWKYYEVFVSCLFQKFTDP